LKRFEIEIKITVFQIISNQNHVENDFLNQKSKSHTASKIVMEFVPRLSVFILIRTDLLLASTVSPRYYH